MFPIVRYTGQAFLSPLNTDSSVLSEDKITGATTAPSGSFPYASSSAWLHLLQSMVSTYLGFPPPVACPQLIIYPIISLCICICTLWSIRHHILQCGIPNQLLHTFHWIPSPQFYCFRFMAPSSPTTSPLTSIVSHVQAGPVYKESIRLRKEHALSNETPLFCTYNSWVAISIE